MSFENYSEMEQTVGGGPIFPLSSIWCRNSSLVLAPSDESIQQFAFGTNEQLIPDPPVEECWQPKPVRFVRHDVLRWHSLDTGECVRTEYAVLHYPEREILEATMTNRVGAESEPDDCLLAGDYRFEQSFLPAFGTDASWEEFTWGFTLTIGEE